MLLQYSEVCQSAVHKGLHFAGLWLYILAEEGKVGGVFAGNVFGVVGQGKTF